MAASYQIAIAAAEHQHEVMVTQWKCASNNLAQDPLRRQESTKDCAQSIIQCQFLKYDFIQRRRGFVSGPRRISVDV